MPFLDVIQFFDKCKNMCYNKGTTADKTAEQKEVKNMKRVYFDGVTESGAYVQSASVLVNEDYTMLQLVTAIKAAGYVKFMTKTMRKFANVI